MFGSSFICLRAIYSKVKKGMWDFTDTLYIYTELKFIFINEFAN